MRIECLCTGDELLQGLAADTNSPYFMGKLLELGEQVAYAQVVGDVQERITAALREASQRADVVLVSGGLGPTADDFTAACAAEAAGVQLVEHPGVLEHLRSRLAQRGRTLTSNNAKQAWVPEGAEVVQNPVGSAPMFVLDIGRCRFFFVAGVPHEYRALVDREVLPRLSRMIGAEVDRVFRAFALLRTVGLPESELDARIKPVAEQHPHVAFGFRTQAPENHLKLLASGKTQAEADTALSDARRACVDVLGQHLFAEGERPFEAVVGELLIQQEATVSVAESCTGGRVCEVLSRTPGASRFLQGGVVVYQDALKTQYAGVEPELIAAEGVVSAPVAVRLAEGIRARLGTHYGLSVTGYAGPEGGTERAPLGTVFIAVAGPKGVEVEQHRFGGERQRVREQAAVAVLDLLRRQLLRGMSADPLHG